MRWVEGLAVWTAASAGNAVAIGAQALATGAGNPGGPWVTDPGMSLVVVGAIGLLLGGVVTLPGLWVLARLKRLAWWTAGLSGLGGGIVLTLGIMVLASTAFGSRPTPALMGHALLESAWIPVVGALAGWAAWRMAQRRVKPEDTAEVF